MLNTHYFTDTSDTIRASLGIRSKVMVSINSASEVSWSME